LNFINSQKKNISSRDNIDAKVFIGNISTEKITDEELLDFFKSFGKVSGFHMLIISIDYLNRYTLDIRVFKDHIFVQYNRIDDANKLITAAQVPLIFKGNKLGKK
jgi:RNA recognition motif-containing protein